MVAETPFRQRFHAFSNGNGLYNPPLKIKKKPVAKGLRFLWYNILIKSLKKAVLASNKPLFTRQSWHILHESL